jgi:hypothetical protein
LKWETHEFSKKHLADQNRLIEMKIREGKEERLSYAFLPCVYYNWGMNDEELNHYFSEVEYTSHLLNFMKKHKLGYEYINNIVKYFD